MEKNIFSACCQYMSFVRNNLSKHYYIKVRMRDEKG